MDNIFLWGRIFELTESTPSRSKNAVGPFSFSIVNMLVSSSELDCCWRPILSLRSRANIFRISFPDMLCPPITSINWDIIRTIVSPLSCENQFRRKSSIPALTHEAWLDRESLSRWRNVLSPWCCSKSLLCPIIEWWGKLLGPIYEPWINRKSNPMFKLLRYGRKILCRLMNNKPFEAHWDKARSHLHSDREKQEQCKNIC